jgi:hypothetical protein
VSTSRLTGDLEKFSKNLSCGNRDHCNCDGYTNSIYTLAIGAIDHKGLHPPYSEACSALIAVTYSSGSGAAIVSPFTVRIS